MDEEESVLADLETNYHRPCKWTRKDFEEKIAHYQTLNEAQRSEILA